MESLPQVPVVVVGPSDDEMRRASLGAGAGTYVERESSLDQLVESIRSIGFYEPGLAAGYNGLTDREREVAELIAEGRSNREIADALTISRQTAKNHVWSVFRRLGVHRRAEFLALFGKRL